jgi:hypothetical protein
LLSSVVILKEGQQLHRQPHGAEQQELGDEEKQRRIAVNAVVIEKLDQGKNRRRHLAAQEEDQQRRQTGAEEADLLNADGQQGEEGEEKEDGEDGSHGCLNVELFVAGIEFGNFRFANQLHPSSD